MNGQRVTIHVGYHKTGTTFLQQRVFAALPVNFIRTPDVDYLATSADFDPARFRRAVRPGGSGARHDETVLSQETLSGRADGDPSWDPFRIADRLHRTFPSGRILMVIRNQFDYLRSLYAYRVATRGLERRELADYLRDHSAWLLRKLSYHELIGHYLGLYTRERVLVLPYELLAADHDAFVGQVLGFMGLEATLEYDAAALNPSTRDARVLRAHRLANIPPALISDWLRARRLFPERAYGRFVDGYSRVKRGVLGLMIERAGDPDGPGIDLDAPTRALFQPAFEDSNRRLAELLDLDLARYGYP